MNEFSLRGRRALITGGTRGIGRAISCAFAAAGASVVANYVRNEEAAAALTAFAHANTLQIEVCRADSTADAGLDRLSEAVGKDGQTLGILVHCAATGVHRPLAELTPRHFDFTYALNVRAFFQLVRRFAPAMASDSSILAISSAGAVRAVPQYALVGSSKAALESLVRHFAVDLSPRGVRVNALSAGPVVTDAWKVLPDADARLAEAARRSPLNRLNTLDEIAWTAQFLCSDAARGIVGQTIFVDGGLSIVA
jgi:enoyl-[acyl-carrier protein] reductase III